MINPLGTATILGLVPFDEKTELRSYALLGEGRLQGLPMSSDRNGESRRAVHAEPFAPGRLTRGARRIRLEQIHEDSRR